MTNEPQAPPSPHPALDASGLLLPLRCDRCRSPWSPSASLLASELSQRLDEQRLSLTQDNLPIPHPAPGERAYAIYCEAYLAAETRKLYPQAPPPPLPRADSEPRTPVAFPHPFPPVVDPGHPVAGPFPTIQAKPAWQTLTPSEQEAWACVCVYLLLLFQQDNPCPAPLAAPLTEPSALPLSLLPPREGR